MNMWGKSGAGALALLAGLQIGAAQAQGVPPGCVASNPGGAAAGALIGGVAGALIGNAVSGHKAGGTIVGGVTGAAAGAMIGGSQPSCPDGYVYRAAPALQPVPVVVRDDDFWYGAPSDMHERLTFMTHRVDKLVSEGWITPRDYEGIHHSLAQISYREEQSRSLNGGRLPPPEAQRLEADLDVVARRLRWKEYRVRHGG